jgi:hypothetical protein
LVGEGTTNQEVPMSTTPQKRIWPVRVATTAIATLAIGGGFVIAGGDDRGETAAPPRVFGSADALAHHAEQQLAGAPVRIVASADALAQRAEQATSRAARVYGSADALAHRAERPVGPADYGSADALAARFDD